MNQQAIQQAIQKAKQSGYTDDQINQFLRDRGVESPAPVMSDPSQFQIQTSMGGAQDQPKRETAGGFLGFMAPAIASLPQAIGRWQGEKIVGETLESSIRQSEMTADRAVELRRMIEEEKNPEKKEELKEIQRAMVEQSFKDYQNLKAITDGDWVTRATEIDLGPLGRFPGLESSDKGGIQQIAGRSVRQIGVGAAPSLGMAGTGAFYGAGTALERGEGIGGIAKESAKMAVLFKTTGWAFGKVANTPLGERVLTSPVGSTIFGTISKVTSPFMATPAASGSIGAQVDKIAERTGSMIDRVFSPSTYTKPTGSVLRTIGEKTGVLPSEEERVVQAKSKINSYWDSVKQGKKSLMKNDANSPKVLADEGIIPEVRGGKMYTMDQAEIVGQKASAEHRLLNSILEKSGGSVSTKELRRQAISQINSEFRGIERQQALDHFNRQFDALLGDVQTSLITTKGGATRIPLKMANDFKSYMWGQGYPSELATKSDAIAAESMRVSGNAFKNTILSESKKLGPDINNSIISLNKHTGDLLQAKKFLEATHGDVVKGGRLGGYFKTLYMTMIGGAFGGAAGGVAGYLGADAIVGMMQNPSIKLGKAVQIIQLANKTKPGVWGEALKTLNGINPPIQ